MASGSIVKRSGNYAIVYYVDGKQKWKTIGSNKKEAEKALRQVMSSIDHNEYQDKDMSFPKFVAKWLESQKAQVKPSTLEFYRNIGNQLASYFEHRQIRAIGTADIEDYMAAKLEKLSNTTVGYHLTVARMIFKKAQIWGYVFRNPTEFIKKPRSEHKEVEILSHEQIDRLLAVAEGQARLLVLTAVLTGMRAGELMALRWAEVDLVDGKISVIRNYVRGRIETPKSRGSVRSIVIPPMLIDELARAKETATNQLVFTNSKGKPIEWNNFINREFSPLLKLAELPRGKFHSLRHSYASTLVAAGEDLKFIQTQLGHSNLTMTLNTYSHLLPGKSAGAGQRIQAAFGINKPVRSSISPNPGK